MDELEIIPLLSKDWLFAFIGGIIIGVATSLNFMILGRITGNSGVFNTLIKFDFKEGFVWKL